MKIKSLTTLSLLATLFVGSEAFSADGVPNLGSLDFNHDYTNIVNDLTNNPRGQHVPAAIAQQQGQQHIAQPDTDSDSSYE